MLQPVFVCVTACVCVSQLTVVPSCLCRLSCDKRVVGLMKARTLGNSASALRAALVEQHTKDWLVRTLRYLSVLEQLQVPGVAVRRVTVLPMRPIPNVPWLISVYARDALGRLEETKGRITSVFGDILKMDSTKKASLWMKIHTQ